MFTVDIEQLNPASRIHLSLLKDTLLLFFSRLVKKQSNWLQIWIRGHRRSD